MLTPRQAALIEELMDELGLDWHAVREEYGIPHDEKDDLSIAEASDLISELIDQKREEEFYDEGYRWPWGD